MVSRFQEIVNELLELIKKYEKDIVLVIGVILISLLSFAIGYLVAKEQLKEPIQIEDFSSADRQ
ncbi:MAG: hypothetical protein HYW95_00485 [Candidatus Wildermuthbacteria bacterium]|nr:hypothetical protein [Candidatus Wildermuthbacteria bacterium]